MATTGNAVRKTRAARPKARDSKARGYNSVKAFDGKQYTGMQVGRSHKWNYDKGVWGETKATPDRWKLTYDVIKLVCPRIIFCRS